MKNEERSTMRTYAWVAGGLVAFFILAAVVVSFWSDEKAPKSVLHPAFQQDAGGPLTASGRPADYTDTSAPPPTAKAAAKAETEAEGSGDGIHPLLANVELEEIAAEEEPEETDPDRILAKRLVSLMTQPLKKAAGKLPSFISEGRMKVTVPAPVKTEEEFKEGKRFEPGVEVTGRFQLTKDEQGNFRLEQETHTSKGNAEYDGDAYNGVLYKVDGQYTYQNLKGEIVGKETLDKVLATFAENGDEPLVYRNWSEIVKEVSQVVSFNPVGKGAYEETYTAEAANPEVQKSTVELSSLSGGVTVLPQHDVMGSGSLNGAGVLRHGYMSGAPVSYDVSVKVTQVGDVPPIQAP